MQKGRAVAKPAPRVSCPYFWGEAAHWLSLNSVKPQSCVEVSFGVTALWDINDVDLGKV